MLEVSSVQRKKMTEPNALGFFGEYGGRYVPEPLVGACQEVEAAFRDAWSDTAFRQEFLDILTNYVGRPSPLTDCVNLSEDLGLRLMLKREDLNHTGSHKINNVIGQALLAKRMGKTHLIAETGAGQHGVATATAAALFGMTCTVYMGEVDIKRQELNVYRMGLLGATVIPASSGSRTLKDAVNEAMRAWVTEVEHTYYCIGTVMGPHPYPWMVRSFHEIIGCEAQRQVVARLGKMPDVAVACVGGGVPAVVHGMKAHFLQDEVGQVVEAESISAGLDYPGVGPEHSNLADMGRAEYYPVTDDMVVDAFQVLSKREGIIPALESAHAIAWVIENAEELAGKNVLVNLSGRGDKDVAQVRERLGE
jgi:tryptophan synthase beta chain